ncbi:cuticle protein 8-like [Amyelois transitella]|uniref:cuticle protein 8-like n=1 Tax=Amyelois transitella TaxID=680683 RepID=UPI00067C10A7|nr:cuticle protein 8-like [Amyelois transitella]
MFWQLVAITCLAMISLNEGRAVSEQKIRVKYEKEEKPEHHEEYAWAYPSYEFSYKVEDEHTHDIKSQQEHRHGDEVKGEYWLVEPDGRKRLVKYHADKHRGFQADVEYSAPHNHVYHKSKHNDEDNSENANKEE